jgi:carboxylate-amine ligase
MEAERPSPTPSQEVLAECSYQATRYGLRARLLDDNGIQVPAEALARWRLAQAAPFARELDAESALLGVERILSEGNGADRQRLAFRRGGFAQLLRQVAGETAREPAL